MKAATRAVAAAALAACAACGPAPEGQARGGGLEGETLTLEGRALYADGSPAVAAEVRLRASDAADSTAGSHDLVATTDADGRYRVAGVSSGDYFLITEADSARGAFQEVHVAPPESVSQVVAVQPDTVKPKGVIRVRVLPPPGRAGLPPGLLQVVGFRQYPIDSSGLGLAPDVPPGTYFVRAVYPSLGMQHRLTTLAVAARDTSEMGPYAFALPQEEDLSAWKYSATVRLNTTPAGANVAENVMGFPILLRLDSAHLPFPFEKLGERGDGGDLRFTDAKGKRLPFEIEWWDGPNRRAQVWVRIDTVYGNRADQAVTVRFGKSDVFSATSPQATFDTADGWRAAWHFSQYNSGGVLSDATRAGNLLRMGAIRKEGGVTGYAWTSRAGDELGAAANKSQEPPGLTLAGWFKPMGTQDSARLIWKHRRGESAAAYALTWRGAERALEFSLADDNAPGGVATVRAAVPASQDWIHFAATFEAKTGTASLYVNGQRVGTATGLGRIDYRSSGDLMLGSQPGGLNGFQGALDEVRLFRGPWSPARVALEYQNQKPGARWLSSGGP